MVMMDSVEERARVVAATTAAGTVAHGDFQKSTQTNNTNTERDVVKQMSLLRESTVTLWSMIHKRDATRNTKQASETCNETAAAEANGVEETKGNNSKCEKSGEQVLCDFMMAAGEPITWVESRELWRGLRKTNNGKMPCFNETFMDQSNHSMRNLDISRHCAQDPEDLSSESTHIGIKSVVNKSGFSVKDIMNLTAEELDAFTNSVARGIKEEFSIRLSDDLSERNFIILSLLLLWSCAISVGVAGHLYPDNAKLGTFTPAIILESVVLFSVELIWECFLSWIVLKYNIKVNYTRKLGNLLKVPKYFAADLFPFYTSTGLSMTTALAFNQTLFCLMYYRRARENVPFFSYVFLSQDRREDRPDTLIFQVTEDIMRYAIYFPFKLFVVDLIGSKAIIFIPIAVNNIGDGLAEPVGVAYGRHKYTTTALYHKGRFFHSKFTRSFEGSACVYFTTVIVVAASFQAFNKVQFWTTIVILPFLMTLAEAKAPHTNDGPFLALFGCGFLSAVFLIGRESY